jgi:hypothetical protein
MASFNASKFLCPNDLTIAEGSVRIENLGVAAVLVSALLGRMVEPPGRLLTSAFLSPP